MNRFQLEDFLLKNKEDEIIDDIENNDEVIDFLRNVYGGDDKVPKMKLETKVQDTVADSDTHMEIYTAVTTRPEMSKFEYVGCITALAQYLKGLKSIAKYIDIVNCNSLINPCELAFHLLDQGKMNVIIIRNRCEKVSFSTLRVDELLRQEIVDHFEKKNASMEEEFYKVLADATK